MYFLDPRVHDLLPRDRHRGQLASYLNLVASQTNGIGQTLQPQKWFAEKLAVTIRTIKRWEAALEKLGFLEVVNQLTRNRRSLAIGRKLFELLGLGERGHHRPRKKAPASPLGSRAYKERARATPRNESKAASNSKAEPGEKKERGPKPGWATRFADWIAGGKRGPKPAYETA